MEEKKSTGLVVVVAVLCLLIGCAGGYFIADRMNGDKNVLRDSQCPTCSNTEQKKCKYEKLKDPALLTDDEKNQIYSQIDYIISPETKKITKADDYTYLISFDHQDADATDSTTTFVTFWKENGVWKHGDYYGSGYEPTPGNSLMCTECGDCN